VTAPALPTDTDTADAAAEVATLDRAALLALLTELGFRATTDVYGDPVWQHDSHSTTVREREDGTWMVTRTAYSGTCRWDWFIHVDATVDHAAGVLHTAMHGRHR